MKYIKYKPSILLEKYIDFYWILQTESDYQSIEVPLFADACTDIFINLGNTAAGFNTCIPISVGQMYMGGPATTQYLVHCFANSLFIGIRFKPGGLPLFFDSPLCEMVDQIIEFRDNTLFSILDLDDFLPQRLDQYFLSKKKDKGCVSFMVDIVEEHQGQLTVDMLARKSNKSNRTLERIFYTSMGIGPKEFINIVRFQRVLKTLRNGKDNGKWIEMAFEMGYCDLAHFIKDVKKHSGLTPSGLGPGRGFP